MHNKLGLKGTLTLVLTDEHGVVKEQREENLIVNLGLAFIISRMQGAGASVMSHMAIGTSTTAAAGAQTALVTETARVAATPTIVTTTIANDTAQYVGVFGAGVGTGTITEAGIFNASSAGTMLSRSVFSGVAKGASDVLTITWKIQGS